MGDNSVATFSWQPLPDIAFCAKRQRLREALSEAMQQLIMLRDQQVAAVIGGDDDFTRFDPLIHLAQEKKSEAKYAYIFQAEKRGC